LTGFLAHRPIAVFSGVPLPGDRRVIKMRYFRSTSFLVPPMLVTFGCAVLEPSQLATTSAAIVYQTTHIAVTGDPGKLSTLASVGGALAVDENCLVPDRDLDGDLVPDPVPIRIQLLIYRGSILRGVCTVAGSSGSDVIYVTATAFQDRVTDDVWSPSEPGVTITYPTVKSNATGSPGANYALPAATTSTLVGLSSPSNAVKEYYNAQAAPQVLYTWPHLMENGILPLLEHHAATTGARTWEAAWAVKFNSPNTFSPFIDFHITSTNIGASYPMLWQHTADGGQKLPYALSYHSHGTCGNIAVRVGGRGGDSSEKAMHRGLAETIHLYSYDPVNDPSLFATKRLSYRFGDCFDGSAPLNFINQAAASTHGIQLEQSFSWINTVVGATTRGKKVVNAVRSVFDCLAEAADATAGPFAGGSLDSGASAAYAATGLCPGFIADLQLGDATEQVVVHPSAALATCSGGGKVQADFYRRQTDGGVQRWRRIGGGRVSYDASCNPTRQILGEHTGEWEANPTAFGGAAADWTVAAGATNSFRAVVRGFDAAGNAAPVSVTLAP
jgi:hypothetical protein